MIDAKKLTSISNIDIINQKNKDYKSNLLNMDSQKAPIIEANDSHKLHTSGIKVVDITAQDSKKNFLNTLRDTKTESLLTPNPLYKSRFVKKNFFLFSF